MRQGEKTPPVWGVGGWRGWRERVLCLDTHRTASVTHNLRGVIKR